MTALLANASDIADTAANLATTRDAVIGWLRANMNITNMVADLHREAMMVRRDLKRSRLR